MKGKNTLLGIVASSGILLSCNSNLKTETEVYKPSNKIIVESFEKLETEEYATEKRDINYFKNRIGIYKEYTRKLEEEIIPKYVEVRENWESLTNN